MLFTVYKYSFNENVLVNTIGVYTIPEINVSTSKALSACTAPLPSTEFTLNVMLPFTGLPPKLAADNVIVSLAR